jgi:protein-disulfide isomerase
MTELLLHSPRLTVPVSERDHVLGPARASLTLLEYGDYQCPFCGAAQPVLKEIGKTLGDELRFVFRHFPLTQAHPNAGQAAEAAESAGAQGRFWQMHDLLYANQTRLRFQDFVGYAQLLALDVDRFASDLREHTFAARVREDFLSGIRSGVNGTPTFFVNGVRHNGGWDLESLLEALRTAR